MIELDPRRRCSYIMSHTLGVHEIEETSRGTDRGGGGGASKHDGEKVRLELVPTDVVFALGRVATFGAKKYAAWNWARGMDWSRVYGACQRHLNDWYAGKD